MMLDFDDNIAEDDDWLYEEEKPKKKTNSFSPYAKQIPPEWTQKGCETVDDPAEKERLRKELEKKEKKRQQNREAQRRWQEKKKTEKEAAKEREKAEQPKMTLADLAEELKNMEKTEVDACLEEFREREETAEDEVKTEMPLRTPLEVSQSENKMQLTNSLSEQETRTTQTQDEPERDNHIHLALSESQAESLYMFIKDELLGVVKRDDVDELDWLVDMCSIYSMLKEGLVRHG